MPIRILGAKTRTSRLKQATGSIFKICGLSPDMVVIIKLKLAFSLSLMMKWELQQVIQEKRRQGLEP
ncbi:MAG: hypothetical protein V7L22_08890 [Nostoc sp.]